MLVSRNIRDKWDLHFSGVGKKLPWTGTLRHKAGLDLKDMLATMRVLEGFEAVKNGIVTKNDLTANSVGLYPDAFGITNGADAVGNLLAGAHDNGLSFSWAGEQGNPDYNYVTAKISSTANPGCLAQDPKGAYLGNPSDITADMGPGRRTGDNGPPRNQRGSR